MNEAYVLNEADICVGGDGGPLIVLQAAAVPHWEGVGDWDNSLMNGGDIETDYDVICDCEGEEEIHLISRHDRQMLVLWDSEFGGSILAPELLSLPADTIVLTMCYHPNDLPAILPRIRECMEEGKPRYSMLLDVQDKMLRLQVGADGSEPSPSYKHLDIAVAPGMKRCDVYLVEHDSLHDQVVVITADESIAA